MPPTFAARCMTRSGRASSYKRTRLACSTRLLRTCREIVSSAGSKARSLATTRESRKPEPPVTRTRLPDQNFLSDIRVHHHAYQFPECHFRFPVEFASGLRGIAQQQID